MGKIWEIWSRVMTSGRQRVDTQFLVMSIAGLEAKSVHKTASVQFDDCNARGLVNAKP